MGGLELLPQVPPYLPKYASFLFSFLGRGVCEYQVASKTGGIADVRSLHLRRMSNVEQLRAQVHCGLNRHSCWDWLRGS